MGELLASQTVLLGHTAYDLEAAKRAGVPLIGRRCGGWSDDELAKPRWRITTIQTICWHSRPNSCSPELHTHFIETAPPARFELATCGLGNRCSIQLSYGSKPRS